MIEEKLLSLFRTDSTASISVINSYYILVKCIEFPWSFYISNLETDRVYKFAKSLKLCAVNPRNFLRCTTLANTNLSSGFSSVLYLRKLTNPWGIRFCLIKFFNWAIDILWELGTYYWTGDLNLIPIPLPTIKKSKLENLRFTSSGCKG